MRHILFFLQYMMFFFLNPRTVFGDAEKDKEDRKKDFKAGELWGKGTTTAEVDDDPDPDNDDGEKAKGKKEEEAGGESEEEKKKAAEEEAKNKGKKEEEKKVAGENTNNGGGEDDDVTYEVGKDKLNQKEYDELVAKMVKHYELTEEEIEGMSDKMLGRYLIDFNNLQKAEKAANERHQTNARDKRENTEEKQKLEKMRGDVEREKQTIENEKKTLDDREKELKELLKQDPDDEEDDVKRQKLLYKQNRAEEQLEDIKNDRAELDKTFTKNQQKATAIYLAYVLNNIQESSGITTVKPVEDIMDEASRQDEKELDKWLEKNNDEYTKAKLVNRIMNDYLQFMTANPQSKLTPGQFYKLNKSDYPEAAQPDKKGNEEKKDKPTVKELSVKKAVQNIIKKQKNQPPDPGGHPTDSTESDRNGKGPDKTKRKSAILKNYNME